MTERESQNPEKGGPGPEAPSGGGTGDRRPGSSDPPMITIEDFAKLELRVAVVRAVEPHPNADRLLRILIELGGGETRQVVAGIAGQYGPDDLVGRRICVVANLKPAKLRGEVSQGMLLAASDGEVISVLSPDKEVAPGSKIR